MDDFDFDDGAYRVDAAIDARDERLFDPATLVIGVWFAVLGIVAAIIGTDLLDDSPVVIPISFAVVGLALLVPKRRRARRDDRDW